LEVLGIFYERTWVLTETVADPGRENPVMTSIQFGYRLWLPASKK